MSEAEHRPIPVTIREVSVQARVREAAPPAGDSAVDLEAFRREILEACERIAERAVRRDRER